METITKEIGCFTSKYLLIQKLLIILILFLYLQDNYNKEIIKRQHFGCVETEMTTFPTPALKKV